MKCLFLFIDFLTLLLGVFFLQISHPFFFSIHCYSENLGFIWIEYCRWRFYLILSEIEPSDSNTSATAALIVWEAHWTLGVVLVVCPHLIMGNGQLLPPKQLSSIRMPLFRVLRHPVSRLPSFTTTTNDCKCKIFAFSILNKWLIAIF